MRQFRQVNGLQDQVQAAPRERVSTSGPQSDDSNLLARIHSCSLLTYCGLLCEFLDHHHAPGDSEDLSLRRGGACGMSELHFGRAFHGFGACLLVESIALVRASILYAVEPFVCRMIFRLCSTLVCSVYLSRALF